jgi:hypothetical protein
MSKLFVGLGLLLSVSSLAQSAGSVITLAQDYPGTGQCKYQKGGTLTVDKVVSDQYSTSLKVTYRSPSIFAGGCWSDTSSMSWEQMHDYYLDANPIEKAEVMERRRLEKEAEEKRWADRSNRKIEVGVGDRISVANEAKADNWGRSNGVKLEGTNGATDCSLKAGDLFITKVSADSVEAVVTKNEYRSYGAPADCAVNSSIKLTKEQLTRWYERTNLARNVKLNGLCYEQKNAERTVEQCEARFKENETKFERLRKYCPGWNKIYGWDNLDNVPADKIAADYPGISMTAYRAEVNLNDLKYCPAGVPDASKVRASCLKEIQVKCPGEQVNNEEESKRIDSILHPEKDEQFLQGLIKQQEKNWTPPAEPNFEKTNGNLD